MSTAPTPGASPLGNPTRARDARGVGFEAIASPGPELPSTARLRTPTPVSTDAGKRGTPGAVREEGTDPEEIRDSPLLSPPDGVTSIEIVVTPQVRPGGGCRGDNEMPPAVREHPGGVAGNLLGRFRHDPG